MQKTECVWLVVANGEWCMWEKKTRSHFYGAAIKIFMCFILNQNWTIFFWIFSFFQRCERLLCASVMLCTVSLGGFHEQEKLLNSHYLPMFASWWRNLWCEVRFCVHLRILIECDPGIRADSVWKRMTSTSASNDSDAFTFMRNTYAPMSNTESNKTNIKYTTKCNLCKFGARFKRRLKIWKFFRNNFLHNSRTAANEAWLRPFLAITRR